MTRIAAALALALILFASVALREAAAPGYRATGELARGQTWVVDDPDAAYHLRRVQLTLSNGIVPRFDRYINHPDGSAIPWPPLSDGLFALVARVFADGDSSDLADAALGGYAEDQLESVLVHLPPLLGMLATLAVFAATWVLCERGSARVWFALFAAWIYAALPTAVWYGGVTRLDHHVEVALLLALHLAWITWSLRARESVDALSGALAAGLTAGMAITSWLASGVFVGIAGIAYFLRVLGPDRERARFGTRAGVLYFMAAASVTMFPASTSAWNAIQPGSLINLTDAVPNALFAAIVPFVVLAFARAKLGEARSERWRAGVFALAVFGVTAWFLPGFVDGVREGIDWASRQNLFMDVVAESRPLDSSAAIVSKLSYLAFLFPLAGILLLPSTLANAERAHLVLLAAAMGWMTLEQQRFGNTLAVPFACVLALGFHDAFRRVAQPGMRLVLGAGMGAAALTLLFSVNAVFAPTDEEYADLADWRTEVVRGLRWMRSETPSPGPFNSPYHPQNYAVLSSWGLGHQIEYHARRPTITTNFGSFVGEHNFREGARALLETDPAEFVSRLRILGADYVVVTPRLVSDIQSTMRIAGEDPAQLFVREPSGYKRLGPRAHKSALWRLALHGASVGSQHYPGLELVWCSPRLETPQGTRPRAGEPAGPVLSIYRLLEGRGAKGRSSMKSGR